MADDTTGSAQQAGTGPSLNLLAQYIKDLSFENPRAPDSIIGGNGQPSFTVNINVGVNRRADDLYAVELTFTAKASREEDVLFNVELVYGGMFRLRNWPEPQLAPVLMIECPRLLFPFARQVLANTTQQGGFPPLLMDPVDFTQIYRQNLATLAAQQQNAGAGESNGNTPPPSFILDKKPN